MQITRSLTRRTTHRPASQSAGPAAVSSVRVTQDEYAG